MNDLQWTRQGHDHGAALARDLGYTPVYLHYNSGLHVSTNGRAFAALLEQLVARVAGADRRAGDRRAQHGRAGGAQRLPRRRGARRTLARSAAPAGLPRHAAPRRAARARRQLGRPARSASAGTARRSRASARSAAPASPTCATATCSTSTGQGRDRFAHGGDDRAARCRCPPASQCYAIAATSRARAPAAALPGDGLVPVDSALGRHAGAGADARVPRGAPVDRSSDGSPRPARAGRGVRDDPVVALLVTLDADSSLRSMKSTTTSCTCSMALGSMASVVSRGVW